MLISKKKRLIFSLCLFIAGFIALNGALSFALKPYKGLSEMIWSDFYGEKNIYMLYFGSSIGSCDYDPRVIDSSTGLKSFNLSSNSQPLIASYWGLKRAIMANPSKYVILNVDYSNLESHENMNAKAAYVQAFSQQDNLFTKVLNFFVLAEECGLKEKESLNIFFPWIYNHVGFKRKDIYANIRKKLDDNYAKEHPEDTDLMTRGHFEPTNVKFKSVDLDKAVGTNSKSYYKITDPHRAVSSNAYKTLDKIIYLCQDNQIQLIVTFAPRPAFDSLSLGNSYFEINDTLRHYFEERGVPFYDLNMWKKDFWRNDDRYYYNFEHMNQYGAESFSAAFAKFFEMIQHGEDVTSLFYSPDEYLASIDYIAGVLFQATPKEDAVSIHISSYQGTGVQPEYQVQVYDKQSDGYVTLRDFSTDTNYVFRPSEKGKYKIRVNARRVGSMVPYERYCEKSIDF